MKVATWNVRGFNKLYKHKEFARIVKKSSIDIIAIVEHKVLKNKAHHIINKAHHIINKALSGWKWQANYGNRDKGRIWILWNNSLVNVTILHFEDQLMLCLVKDGKIKGLWLNSQLSMGYTPLKTGRTCGRRWRK